MIGGLSLARRGADRSEADFRAAAARAAAALSEAGAGPGVVVAHQFPLDAAGVVALAAIADTGAILAPAHPGWTPSERDAFLDAVRPSLALTAPDAPPAAWPASGGGADTVSLPGFGDLALHRRMPAADRPGDRRSELPPAWAEPPQAQADPRGGVILATSGSGGVPHYVVHEWRSLRANAAAANERLGFGPDDRWLATLAWAHVGGLAVPLRAAVAGAAVGLASPRFDADTVARALADLKITHVSLVPAMLHRLLDTGARPPDTLRAVLLGGAATPPPLVDRALDAGWPIALTYGLTEAGSQVATATPCEVRGGERSCGRPLPGVQVRIRPAGSAGHIEIRGATLFRGYAGEPPRAPDAWFATGDLGRLDPDGRLTVTGRLRDRIVSGGVNVDPVHVEAVLAQHADVREAAVLGLPDDTWGQIVAAVLVPRAAAEDDLVARVSDWCRERLSGARVPRRWDVSAELPRTATGKVDRARLRDILQANRR